ncbi:MAG: ABC transporter permease subunit [Gemmatimonadetes bacterium]|nr:ABC transporter permease subunit [Gemmatimonadota bacterium]MXY82014.1 ABC transporter permease subunit [Gemmatimonadota bacterium]
MLTTIIKREFIAHIQSLWFSLALVLCVSLMVLNAIGLVHSTYQLERDTYIENVAQQHQTLRTNAAASLQMMLLKGPGLLYKQPSELAFCAGFADNKLPDKVDAVAERYSMWAKFDCSFYWPWILSFPEELEDVPLLSTFITIDWVFIVGVLLSLVALLFTHDAIVGEKESGTLKLVMANSLPFHTLLWGKFLGAMMVLIGVLLLGLTLNLLIVLVLADLSLNVAHAVRIAIMALISVVYLAGCTSLGLLLSAHSSSRQGSLTTVLFVWVSMVLLWPQMGKAIAELFYEDIEEVNIYGPLREEAAELVRKEAVAKGHLRDPVFLKEFSSLLQSERAHHQKLENALLRHRVQQVNLAQNIVRVSPMGAYQYALEAMAGTGLPRYRHFIDQARSYAQYFEGVLLAIDRADSHSLHIPLVKNGLSTQKVKLEQIPVFSEDLSAASLASSAVVDLALLGFFAVFTYLAAYLVWLRSSIVG